MKNTVSGDTKRQVEIDTSLVRRLIASQFPQWAGLRIEAVQLGGWDNRTFHLGEYMSIRLPSAEPYSHQVQKEHHWLPRLAPFLPLSIPIPIEMGKPAEGYPWSWSVYRWLDGQTASVDSIDNLNHFASELAEFLVALQKIDATEGPPSGPLNFYRGGSLKTYDGEVRQAILTLGNRVDTATTTEVWEVALASIWQNPPVWVHGDISVGNLLVKN